MYAMEGTHIDQPTIHDWGTSFCMRVRMRVCSDDCGWGGGGIPTVGVGVDEEESLGDDLYFIESLCNCCCSGGCSIWSNWQFVASVVPVVDILADVQN